MTRRSRILVGLGALVVVLVAARLALPHLVKDFATFRQAMFDRITLLAPAWRERNPADLHVVKVTEANLTYVAIDAQGQPRLVPRP